MDPIRSNAGSSDDDPIREENVASWRAFLRQQAHLLLICQRAVASFANEPDTKYAKKTIDEFAETLRAIADDLESFGPDSPRLNI